MGDTKRKLTARTADKYVLYQESVQDPHHEIRLASRVFEKHSGRRATSLREDFCGTALIARTWVESHRDRTAVGVDLDQEVLGWADKYNRSCINGGRSRLSLRRQDVRKGTPETFDVIVALNYSCFVFKTRSAMLSYFESVIRDLKQDGVFILDAYGGHDSQVVLEEKRRQKGFVYVWNQHDFNPVNSFVRNFIHFRFPDGTELRRAFEYDWRLWQLVELRELLEEAGFTASEVYAEDETEDGDGTGVFRRRTRFENAAGWNAYIVAQKRSG